MATLIEPTPKEKDRALKLALEMRRAQQRYYAALPNSEEKKNALMEARDLESKFDRMTRTW